MDIQQTGQLLDQFAEITGIQAKWRILTDRDIKTDYADGIVRLTKGKTTIEIPADQINTVRNHHLPHLINVINHNKKAIVVAQTIPPHFKRELQKLGVNYIDGAGNAYINHEPFFVMIEGKKAVAAPKELRAKPFSKAGLRVIFQLFLYDDFINETFRVIAKAAGVSLDTVHKTINGLKDLQYLIPVNKYTLQWNNKKELFNRWMTEYETRLKPSLHVGNFTFINEKDFPNWKKLKFNIATTKWGGEPAAELLTNHLRPEKLTIYSSESRVTWIQNYKFIPNPKGYISIYERFWKTDESGQKTVPALLAYTDLINTANSRNIETAQKIYEQYLQDKF